MSHIDPVCKNCGAEVHVAPGQASEYCEDCRPHFLPVTPAVPDQLHSVPQAYRKLVASGTLHDIQCSGDVEFLYSEGLFAARQASDCVEKNPHLQPFAQTAGGELWCWTSFRTGHGGEPEILQVSDWRVVVYAPSFQTFLYRAALEDAFSGDLPPDELPGQLLLMAKILQDTGCAEFAEDLTALSKLPVREC